MKPWGCYNRAPLREEALVQDGWTKDGRRKMICIPVPMTKDCQFSKGADDPRCAGCVHKQKRIYG
jgi:hypothetical protein